VNGGNHLGLVVAQKTCDSIIKCSSKNPICLVAATNYLGTTGAMGYYARQIANEGLICIVFCNSEYAVAPWGGKDPILGTNPIAFGIPTNSKPIVVDFATSAKTYGELMLAAESSKKIREGIVLDKDGNPSTDPNDANNGCQLPMAEHKGYGLGLVIEILSGIFIGAKAGKDAVKGSDGFVIISFKPDIFVTKSAFHQNIQLLINEIINSSVAPGFKNIRIPGESSLDALEKRQKSGLFEINESVYKELIDLAI